MAHIPRTSKLRSDVLTAGFILEIGQWESNGLPSVILGGPFSKKKGVQERGHQIQIHSAFWDFWHSTWVGLVGRFAAILEHSGQLRKPRLQLYRRIPDVCLVKWWLKTKNKQLEALKVKSKCCWSNQCCCQWCFRILYFKKVVLNLSLGLFFGRPIWPGDLNFMRDFFPNCGNPARPRSKIIPVSVKWKAAWNDFWYIASSPSNLLCTITGIKGRFGAL